MALRIDRRWLRVASWAAGLMLCAVFCSTRSGSARAEEMQRVLLIAPANAELTARILGQTRDLGVTLQVADSAGPNGAEAAARAGAAQAAAIVVWTEAHGAAGLDLHVLEVETRELRTRRVSTPAKEALASSTTAEMAALVVRSELSALLSEIKAKHEPKPAESAAPAQVAVSAPAKVEAKNDSQPVPPPEAARPWTLWLAYRPSRPFHATFAHGIALAARRDVAGFAVGLAAIGSLPFKIENAGTEIRLNRLQLRLEGHKRWEVHPSLQLVLGVAAGLSVDFRNTTKVEAPLVSTGSATTFSGSFGLLGQVEWLFSARVGGLLGIGADAVPWRTTYVYDSGDGQGTVARLSWLDVWAMVGFFTRFGG